MAQDEMTGNGETYWTLATNRVSPELIQSLYCGLEVYFAQITLQTLGTVNLLSLRIASPSPPKLAINEELVTAVGWSRDAFLTTVGTRLGRDTSYVHWQGGATVQKWVG